MGVKTLDLSPDQRRRERIGCGGGCGPGTPRRQVSRHLPLLPTLVLVLLPKCPLCVAAWLGILGSLGTSAWVLRLYGMPLTLALVGAPLCALGISYRATREPRPLLVGLLGTLILLLGRGPLDVLLLVYVGLFLLSAAVVWSNLAQARASRSRSAAAGSNPTSP